MIKAPHYFLGDCCFAAAGSMPLLVSPLPAQQQIDRAHQIGGKFMCMCSCNQVLTQCNHVGCTTSTAMLKEMDQGLAQGDSEDSHHAGFRSGIRHQGLRRAAALRFQPGGLEHACCLSGYRTRAGALCHQPVAQAARARR